MQSNTAFREPRWSILFQDAYNETVHTLIRDWAFMGGSIVLALVLTAWIHAAIQG